MKQKIGLMLLTLCLASSFAFAQIDQATGTVTNDTTQSRLRVAHLVFDGPNVDLLVNGKIPVNGSVPQGDLFAGYIGGYLYLEPRTYSVAVVPTGKRVDEALIGPLDIQLEAGHRYTLAVVGQIEDESLKPLVMDDTEILQEARTSPEQGILILVNNLAGTETLDFTLGGKGPTGVGYGSFAAAPLAMPYGKPFKISTNVGVLEENEAGGGQDPAVDFTFALAGHFSDNPDEDSLGAQSVNTSDLNTVAFLQHFSGLGFEWDGHPISFDTFLRAVETTGLTEMLETSSPYVVFPPTDEAFATLPEDEFNALMADPEALADLVRYHVVEGYYPRGGLTGEEGHVRVLTNLLGMELELLANPFNINGTIVSDLQSYMVANGSRVVPITAVLLPPEQ